MAGYDQGLELVGSRLSVHGGMLENEELAQLNFAPLAEQVLLWAQRPLVVNQPC